MRKLFIILLFTSRLFATDWYVQPATGEYGSENGTSWDNAFDGFTDITWGSISAGDNIYLSDGTYNETMTIGASGSWNNYITIIAGKYSPSPTGHDGEVIIDHNYSGAAHGMELLGATRWIKIKGITIKRTGGSGIYMYANATTANPYRIWIDSCQIYDVGDDECVEMMGYFSGTPTNTNMGMMDTTHHIHHVEISRCYMYTPTNRNMGECNIIYGHLTGNLNIHHNTLWQRNLQEGADIHIDPIQLSYSNYGVKIYNNILMTDSCVTGHTMILGLMARGSDYNDTCIVYNNYIYGGGEENCNTNWKQEILWRAPEGDLPAVQFKPLVYSINNTIVARNSYTANSAAEGAYNPLESNNIIAHYGVNGSAPTNHIGFWYTTYSTGDYKQVDSNKTNLCYMAWGGVDFGGNHWRGNGGSPTGTPSDWADFINPVTYGGSGVNDDPELVNNTRVPTGDPYEISATSPAINAGTNMTYVLQAFEYLPMFDASTDILGNERDSQWDIGAFEFNGSAPSADTTATVTFNAVTNAVRNGYYIASGVLSGADSTFHIYTATADSFKVGALGTYNITIQEAESGDTVFISNIASNLYSTQTTSSIIVSGTTRSFNVTTEAEPYIPPSGNGKWGKQSNGRGIFDKNGVRVITR